MKFLTFVVTLDDEPEYYTGRIALLLRKMAAEVEKTSPTEGMSQGHNFECIKLTKVEDAD